MRLILLLFVFAISQTLAQEITFMTYNIRYDNPGDGENRWDNRKDFLISQWQFHSPEVVGIQEGLHHQVAYLETQMPGYAYLGVGRDDGKTKGEYSAIFYKRDQLKVAENGTFWLSETPHKVSVGWDASMERICTYAKFDRSGINIWVFNTHFDHIGKIARLESAKLILQKIRELVPENDQVVIMGDFNLEPKTPGILIIVQEFQDCYEAAPIRLGPIGTFNGFDYSKEATRRIDYIFADKRMAVTRYGVLSDAVDLRYPSDHFPVIVEVKLK